MTKYGVILITCLDMGGKRDRNKRKPEAEKVEDKPVTSTTMATEEEVTAQKEPAVKTEASG